MKNIFFVTLFLGSLCQGGVLHGVTMADEELISGSQLKLKGLGLRQESILSIILNVYVGGLYVADPKQNCDQIIASDKTKAVYMKFLMRVGSGDLSSSLQEGVKRNCGTVCDQVLPKVKEVKDMVPTAHTDDLLKIIFDSKGVGFSLNGKDLGRVDGETSHVFFSQHLSGKTRPQSLSKVVFVKARRLKLITDIDEFLVDV